MSLVRIQHAERLILRAKAEIEIDNHQLAWKFLEDAHIFAQPFAAIHLYVHAEMFSLAKKERNFHEMIGQAFRFLLAVPASVIGKYPVGNTGRSNVGMFLVMPVSKQVEKKIEELDSLEKRRIENGGVLKKYQRQHPLTRG